MPSSSSEVAESKEAEVIWLPGQKFLTPSPGNGDRVFYETLLEQRTDSEMAQKWCVQYGVLTWDQANEVYSKICKREGKSFSPNKRPVVKTEVAKKAPTGSTKRKSIYDDGDVAMGVEGNGSNVWEGAVQRPMSWWIGY